jgi:hypothetical protein
MLKLFLFVVLVHDDETVQANEIPLEEKQQNLKLEK